MSAIPLLCGWSDLGDWSSVWRELGPDEKGISNTTNTHAFDCEDTLLHSEASNQKVVGLGLKNIIAVATPDAVLVAHKDKSQEVKNVVKALVAAEVEEAENSLKDYRPWGWFERLINGDRFQVKRIFVNPGASLSLQSHKYRSEHWIVVQGAAKVTVDKNVSLLRRSVGLRSRWVLCIDLKTPGKPRWFD